MPLIRPVSLSPSETASLDNIFRTTSGPSFKSEPIATIASQIYCHQYPHLSPTTCFVLETDSGEVVGYILGTPSTSAFCQKWKQTFPSVLAEIGLEAPPDYAAEGRPEPTFEEDAAAQLLYQAYYKPEEMLNGNFEGLWERWPAHFHIDILSEWQRQGWGRKMIETMLRALKAEGARGVQLGMEAGNGGAEKFYKAMGFERFPGVLDGGVSGEMGRVDDRVLYLVKTLEG